MSDYKSAKKALVNRAFFETRKYHDYKLRANREGAHPDILEFEKKFIARFKKMNIPIFTVYCWRTNHEQEVLFSKGRTRARAGQSPHNYGMAVDMVHSTLLWNVPDRKCWDLIGHIGKEVATQNGIDVTWGGDFKSIYDPAHWELTEWRELKSASERWEQHFSTSG